MGDDNVFSNICVFFFFQAEDGIRDYKVTGVQTCALPILDINPRQNAISVTAYRSGVERAAYRAYAHSVKIQKNALSTSFRSAIQATLSKIGRASCRERV